MLFLFRSSISPAVPCFPLFHSLIAFPYDPSMFIGHFAVGYALKRKVPKAALGTLIAAPLFLDLLWPFLLLAGLETVRIDPGNTVVTPLDLHDYPWSHKIGRAHV